MQGSPEARRRTRLSGAAPARTLVEELAEWASALEFDAIPARVRAFASSQLVSQLAAVRAALAHPLGSRLTAALGPPLAGDARAAARSLSALTPWLHYDDTAFAGHLSNTTTNTVLAHARALELDGRSLITALVAANECAARVTAAATLGPFRGQTASATHLAGTAAALLRAAGAGAGTWVEALALAFATPPRILMPGYMTSESSLLSSCACVDVALDACALAEQGLRGARDIWEHGDGFLAHFATVPLPDVITAGLGERWHTETLSFKVNPASPGIDAAVDCALELHRELAGAREPDVAEVVVEASFYTVAVVRATAPCLAGPSTPVPALPSALGYLIATALLDGRLAVEDLAPPRVDSAERWRLARRLSVAHDPAMTRRLLDATAPVGEALRHAGERAEAWLATLPGLPPLPAAGFGAPSATFEEADKATPARVSVRMRDGSSVACEREIPVGAIGPQTRARHGEIVRDKFARVGGERELADALLDVSGADARAVAALLEAALSAPATGPPRAEGACD